jgi:hypothetical protein
MQAEDVTWTEFTTNFYHLRCLYDPATSVEIRDPWSSLRFFGGGNSGDLANRRLQPLGHVSAQVRYARDWPHRQAGVRESEARAHYRHIPRTARQIDPAIAPEHAGRRREVAQILQRLPADDRLRRPHPVPRSHPTMVGGSRASSLSLADALCRRPRRRLCDRMTILRFAKMHPASTGWTSSLGQARSTLLRGKVTSSSWRRPYAWRAPSSSPRSSPSLLSSPYCPPSQSLVAVSHQAPARIAGTPSRLLQAERKKNLSHRGEVDVTSSRASSWQRIRCRAETSGENSRTLQRPTNIIRGLRETAVKSAFL